jgi:hypothetical protein
VLITVKGVRKSCDTMATKLCCAKRACTSTSSARRVSASYSSRLAISATSFAVRSETSPSSP